MTTNVSTSANLLRAQRFLADNPLIKEISVCVPDGANHLRGKTMNLPEFLDGVNSGFAMPNFFLVTDVGNDIIPDDPVSSLDTGFANATLHPRLETLKVLPWDSNRAIVLASPSDPQGKAVAIASETILVEAVARLERLGLNAKVATELEFYVFQNSYTESAKNEYKSLEPLYHRHGDHDILVHEQYGDFFRRLNDAMHDLGFPVIAAHGEGGIGQVEMNFSHGDPMQVADAHTIFKYATKVVGMKDGLAPSFMAKIDPEQAGSSCHIHCSLWDESGKNIFDGDAGDSLSSKARSFIAGLLKYSPDFSLLYAPHANSYSRLKNGSWAPTRMTWGIDNRTILARVLGDGSSKRVEFRLAGADANPYHAIAALLHAGAAGIEEGLELEDPLGGNGYADNEKNSLPTSILSAYQTYEGSVCATESLGSDVYNHIKSRARREIDLKLDAVSNWDLNRLFENA